MTVVNAAVQPGEGTVLQVSISSTMTTVAQVYEIDGPEQLVETIDVTALSTGLILTRPSKFPEPGKVSIKVYYDPHDNNTQGLIVSDVQTPGLSRSWQIQVNDQHTTHATVAFTGFVTSFNVPMNR